MLNFILCDDNPSFLNGLDGMLNKLFFKHNVDAKIVLKTDSTVELLNYVKNYSVDVLFLDITLKDRTNGLDIAEEIRKVNKSLHLIFTTGHFEYIMEAYKVNAFDYLVKPISRNKLEETFLRLVEYTKTSNQLFIKINGKTFIKQEDIFYIQKEGMKLIYYTSDGHYESYNSFSKLQAILPNHFIRCHKSFIVNTGKISHIDSSTNTIFFDSSNKCYIGPKYKNKFMEVITLDENTTSHLARFNDSN